MHRKSSLLVGTSLHTENSPTDVRVAISFSFYMHTSIKEFPVEVVVDADSAQESPPLISYIGTVNMDEVKSNFPQGLPLIF